MLHRARLQPKDLSLGDSCVVKALAKLVYSQHWYYHSVVEHQLLADLHEISPAIACQDRQGLTGHVQDDIASDAADQLQACVTVQDLAV